MREGKEKLRQRQREGDEGVREGRSVRTRKRGRERGMSEGRRVRKSKRAREKGGSKGDGEGGAETRNRQPKSI